VIGASSDLYIWTRTNFSAIEKANIYNNIKLLPYQQYQNEIPKNGYHILAQQTEDEILVYQAFNHAIANFAVKHQYFGGSHYKFSRMSWIKPNFLWMMYRCGWAEKTNQERVLGLWIKKTDFELILNEAVYSSYQADIYETHENWKKALSSKEVRLQWDPDHDIYGQKEERRAIQLGLKGDLLELLGTSMINRIIDMTPFVKTQKLLINTGQLDKLVLPKETTFKPNDVKLKKRLRLE